MADDIRYLPGGRIPAGPAIPAPPAPVQLPVGEGVRPTTTQRGMVRDFTKDFPAFRESAARFRPADQTMPAAEPGPIKQFLTNDPVAGPQARAAFQPQLETPSIAATRNFNQNFRPHEASFAQAGRNPFPQPSPWGPNADPHGLGVASRSAFGTPAGPPEAAGPRFPQGQRYAQPIGAPERQGPPEMQGPRFPQGQRYAQPIGAPERQGPPEMQGPREGQGPRPFRYQAPNNAYGEGIYGSGARGANAYADGMYGGARAAEAGGGFMDDLGRVARGFNGAVEGAGGAVGRVMSSPIINNPLTRVGARVFAPLAVAKGSYDTVNELMDPNSAPRQRFSAFNQNLDAGNVGAAAKNAYYGVGDVIGTFTGLKPLAQTIAGWMRPAPVTGGTQVTSMDNVARMGDVSGDDLRAAYGRLNARAPAAIPSEGAAGSAFPDQRSTVPTMRGAMSSPRESAEAYAARAQAEIDRRRPEREATNREAAERYALFHPKEQGQDKILSNMGHLLQGTGSLEHARAQAATEPQRAAALSRQAEAQYLGSQAQLENARRPQVVDPLKREQADTVRAVKKMYKPLFDAAEKSKDPNAFRKVLEQYLKHNSQAVGRSNTTIDGNLQDRFNKIEID